MKNALIAFIGAVFAGSICAGDTAVTGPQWKPFGNRKAKVVLWGIVLNHALGKFEALRKLTNDYELVGWVDDTASKSMRMQEPKPQTYSIIKPAPSDPEWAQTHSLTILEWPRANATFRVCSRGTQPCRHIRIDGTDGSMELEPIEDFRAVKHMTGLNERQARVDTLVVRMFLKKDKPPYQAGINRIECKAPEDRYAGQLRELARIIRGEIPNPPGLCEHDLRVHKVSLDACNLQSPSSPR